MSFSTESKIAVRKALLRGMPQVGGDTMKSIYKKILGAAGHDKRGGIVGTLAASLHDCFVCNDSGDFEPGDGFTQVFFINGKMFRFTAIDKSNVDEFGNDGAADAISAAETAAQSSQSSANEE